MPKRLSDITHQYEFSLQALEDAQERLASAIESARHRVHDASTDHLAVTKELRDYLCAHRNEVVVSGDFGYHYEASQPGSIRKRPVFWANNIWVEDPEPDPKRTVMATAWGDVEPIPAEACCDSEDIGERI